jgi:hypothetical protein
MLGMHSAQELHRACEQQWHHSPVSRPSSVARRLAMATASSLDTLTTSSMMLVSSTPGTKPAPMPWILCAPGLPPDSTGDSAGSTATSCRATSSTWHQHHRQELTRSLSCAAPSTQADAQKRTASCSISTVPHTMLHHGDDAHTTLILGHKFTTHSKDAPWSDPSMAMRCTCDTCASPHHLISSPAR